MITLGDYIDRYGEEEGPVKFREACPEWKNYATFLGEDEEEEIDNEELI